MQVNAIQDLLAEVEKPSRYLGTELNRVVKDPTKVKLTIALAFPDLYEIGTSHFGIQILYHILNRCDYISAERVFAPASDMETALRNSHQPLCSLENRRPLHRFDIIGFSLLYELNYTNVLNMLDLAGIALKSKDRKPDDPIIIAGGPCVCNPEPMADFFDAMVFGDGEDVIKRMSDQWIQWKETGSGDKNRLLEQWSKTQGVYVPSFYHVKYDEQDFQILTPSNESAGVTVKRTIVADLDASVFPKEPIVPFGRPVHDRLRLEVSRGCSRGCRFCQAGMIYRPVRERSPKRLLDIFDASLANTGYEDLSLLSLSTGDYTCLSALMQNLMLRCSQEHVALSLPSVRAGTLTPELMALIKKVRKTGFTIAPEAGSQRLRDVINKNICYEDVEATVKDAFALGWQVIKLYFMIGLPTETQEDLDAIVQMVKQLKTVKGPAKRRGKINVSITTFIPKPHTPFQWAGLIPRDETERRLNYLKSQLRIPGVQVKWQHPDMSYLEGILSRGDRRIAGAIEKAFEQGCRFDGWTDQFDVQKWHHAFEACGIDTGFFTTRHRHPDEILPWDHMDTGISRDFLKAQWTAAEKREKVQDCRYGKCHQCGVCDHKHLKPVVFTVCPEATTVQKTPQPGDVEADEAYKWIEMTYEKKGKARFFGHLEQANLFSRSLRRTRANIQYSKGFHPMPRISFDDPLPLGMESDAEVFRVLLHKDTDCEAVKASMNASLPDGLRIIRWQAFERRKNANTDFVETFIIKHPDTLFDNDSLKAFIECELWDHEIRSKKGDVKTIDLKKVVVSIDLDDNGVIKLSTKTYNGKLIRPAVIITDIFNLNDKQKRRLRICKLKTGVNNVQ